MVKPETNGGQQCGGLVETRDCGTDACPNPSFKLPSVDCVWSPWCGCALLVRGLRRGGGGLCNLGMFMCAWVTFVLTECLAYRLTS